jgi:hypothetical protein
MRYYFVNTDAISLGGISPHDKWFEFGYAFSGGPESFGASLGRMAPGDICLMYANGTGIVGVGKVTTPWDGKAYDNPLVYTIPFRDVEYRIRVNWLQDFRRNPVACRELRSRLGWNPSRSLQLVKRKQDIAILQQMIEDHRAATTSHDVQPVV